MGRDQAVYLQILWNLYFKGEKVSCLLMFTEKCYEHLKIGKILKTVQKSKISLQGFEPAIVRV